MINAVETSPKVAPGFKLARKTPTLCRIRLRPNSFSGLVNSLAARMIFTPPILGVCGEYSSGRQTNGRKFEGVNDAILSNLDGSGLIERKEASNGSAAYIISRKISPRESELPTEVNTFSS